MYDMPLFRPPSEADSFILQVTLGCSHNKCTFCGMYRTKRFSVVSPERVRAAIAEGKRALGSGVRRVFLADGDAMCLSTSRLCAILDDVNAAFPGLHRIGAYANARDVLSKSDDDLAELRSRKLRLLYMGLESGDDDTLDRIAKGAKSSEIVEAVQRAQAANMAVSVMVLIGLGGRSRSRIHAQASADVVNRMAPTYTALLTYTPVPGTEFFEQISGGAIELPGPLESLQEIRAFLERLECHTYFTCNHASNYLPLKGKLPSAQQQLLSLIDLALQGQIALKPEFLRGL